MYWNGEFINGMTQGFLAPRGFFYTRRAEEDTRAIASLGCNYVALVVNQFQETWASTRIFADNRRTVSDRELVHQINRLRAAGIKVMLKPMLEPLDSVWRGGIALRRSDNILQGVACDYVAAWFGSYGDFLRRYAEIAAETKCELFCVGCELDGMEKHPGHWTRMIEIVRSLYPGPLTYNLTMNIHEFHEDRRWMTQLDLVGVSGYFKVAPLGEPGGLETMRAGWMPWREKLARFADWLARPIFFAEMGTRPVVGAGGVTGDFNASCTDYSEREQADYYRSAMAVLSEEPRFKGAVWWKWDEHQQRPQFHLPDGHYIGCEPTPALRDAMREWCAAGPRARPAVLSASCGEHA